MHTSLKFPIHIYDKYCHCPLFVSSMIPTVAEWQGLGLNEWIQVRGGEGGASDDHWLMPGPQGRTQDSDPGQWHSWAWRDKEGLARYKLANWALSHIEVDTGNYRGVMYVRPGRALIILNIYWADYAARSDWDSRTRSINVSNLSGREKIRMKDL